MFSYGLIMAAWGLVSFFVAILIGLRARSLKSDVSRRTVVVSLVLQALHWLFSIVVFSLMFVLVGWPLLLAVAISIILASVLSAAVALAIEHFSSQPIPDGDGDL